MIAGGPTATHPEPLAPFLDAFVIGDGEEMCSLVALTWARLKREGVHTVGELVARSESDLLDIRNFGQKSIDEVKVKLVELGLSLKDAPPGFDPASVAGYDAETGTWTDEGGEDYAETEQL